MMLYRLLPLRPIIINNNYFVTNDEVKTQNLQIWAVDPWTLSTPVKLSTSNGTLRPLYLIQREQPQNNNSGSSSDNYENTDVNSNLVQLKTRAPRGRSFSPPKKKTDYINAKEQNRFINLTDEENLFENSSSGKLQKSTSSDHIRVNGKTLSSSTSSSNSGTSLRNGGWNRNFKSGIPVPVSSDSRLRFRNRHVEATRGPISVPPQFYTAKSPSPQGTPNRNIVSQRAVLVRQPFSSGSESSEFYTPPAEPHLATNYNQSLEESVLESSNPPESFLEVNSPRYHNENFTVIDDNSSDVLEQNKIFSRVHSANSQSETTDSKSENVPIDHESKIQKQDTIESEDSFQVQNEFESEEIDHVPITTYYEEETSFDEKEAVGVDNSFEQEDEGNIKESDISSVHDLSTYDTTRYFTEDRVLSKSEVNLQISPEISRKSVNSAPALNDVQHMQYRSFAQSQETLEKTSLPGSVTELTPEHKLELQEEVTVIKSTPKGQRSTIPRQLSRKNSVRSMKKDVCQFSDDLGPFPKPKEGFNETVALLDHTDWEMTMKGLQGVLRLTRYHPEIIETHIHSICVALGKHIRNLRSQVSRAACLAASEMFTNHKKALEMDLEELAVPLLHRTADTNKFLRSDANLALDKMCLNMAPPRVVTVIAIKGGGHQNAIVRCAAARLLCCLTNRLGAEKIFQLPKDTRDKILLCGANMLMEGNLETRKHAKMMFGNLMSHSQFNRAMIEAVPACTMRHIQKTLKTLQ